MNIIKGEAADTESADMMGGWSQDNGGNLMGNNNNVIIFIHFPPSCHPAGPAQFNFYKRRIRNFLIAFNELKVRVNNCLLVVTSCSLPRVGGDPIVGILPPINYLPASSLQSPGGDRV